MAASAPCLLPAFLMVVSGASFMLAVYSLGMLNDHHAYDGGTNASLITSFRSAQTFWASSSKRYLFLFSAVAGFLQVLYCFPSCSISISKSRGNYRGQGSQ
jgi:hypothetical protein